MPIEWNEILHLRFTNLLNAKTIDLLKEQVYRTLRDQEKDVLFEQFMNWQSQDKEILLYTDYSPVTFDLPHIFDTIIRVDFPDKIINVKIVIPYCILNGWAAINKIEKGQRHVCLLQFDKEIPKIIKDLPEVNSKKSRIGHEIILYNSLGDKEKSSG